MDLLINTLIIHEVEKAAGSGEAHLFLTDAPTPVDERAMQLLSRLNGTFQQKEDLLHGRFDASEAAAFPVAFAELASEDFGPDSFMGFSRETMTTLQLGLQGITAAKGGYLIYADYLFMDRRFVGLFLVRDAEGLVFLRDADQAVFRLQGATYLNIDKLAMACRIDVNRFLDAQGRYIEVIKHAKSQKEISDYFLDWIGVEHPESSRDLTAAFMRVVEELPLPVDSETGQPMQEEDFRKEVYRFALNNPQKTVSIKAFDEHFYGEETPTRQFLEENKVELDQEFRVDRGAMRQLYYLRLSADGVNLSFSRGDYLSGKVKLEGDRLIIESGDLAEQFRDLIQE